MAIMGNDIAQPTSKPSVPKNKLEVVADGKKEDIEIASWGANNKLPFELLDDIKSITVVGSGLRKRQKIHVGKGLYVYTESVENDQTIKKPHNITQLNDFLRLNRGPVVYNNLVTDYEFFGIGFVEYILNKGMTEILRMYHKHAPYIRISVKEKIKDIKRTAKNN